MSRRPETSSNYQWIAIPSSNTDSTINMSRLSSMARASTPPNGNKFARWVPPLPQARADTKSVNQNVIANQNDKPSSQNQTLGSQKNVVKPTAPSKGHSEVKKALKRL